MADTPIEVDVNTDDLDAFTSLFNGKAEPAKTEAVVDNEQDTPAEDDPSATNPNAADDPEDLDDESLVDENGEEDEGEDDDPSNKSEDDEDDEDDIFKKPKKKQTAKERIAEVTAARRAAERRAEELEARLRQLEQNSREPEVNKPAPRQEQQRPVVDANAPNPDGLDANGNPIYELGQFDPQYIADLSDYAASKRFAEWQAQKEAEDQQAAREKEDARLQGQWQEKLTKAEETLPDLRETVQTLDGEFRNLEPQYGTYLAQTLMDMEHGPQVLYYLANHVDEARAIVAAGPQRATLALGALEAKVAAALEKKAKNPVRTTAAPKPPVTTRGTGGRSATRGDTDNLDAFEKVFFNRK